MTCFVVFKVCTDYSILIKCSLHFQVDWVIKLRALVPPLHPFQFDVFLIFCVAVFFVFFFSCFLFSL